MSESPTQLAPTTRSATSPLIDVRDLSITYRVIEDRRAGLRQLIASGMRRRVHREIRAVRGVTFRVHPGEILGIIGRNGSGKSTLLRGLAGLLPATKGQALATSRPLLLGVGAVLEPALSGRRNVLIGSLALGMSREEVDARFDEIVDFAGVRHAIDYPMRTYSSGMRARLNFSIATAIQPEILLVDEALAVGDQEFKERSNERLLELQHRAGAVVLVSHGLSDLERMCTRVIWLEEGRLVADGVTQEVIAEYQATASPAAKLR